MLYKNANEENRLAWLSNALSRIPVGYRILDAGAGELRNRGICSHLNYVSQDFCQYDGVGDGKGLQTGRWSDAQIDIVSDITAIPEPDHSFDAILCSEVLEHVPNPNLALDEFARLLKPGGKLVITAPFASVVHFAPYHFSTGFSRYWYEYQLAHRNFRIDELTPNGDWFAYCRQELMRLGGMARQYGDWSWPLAYMLGVIGHMYFKIRGGRSAEDVACFGWNCVATKL